MQIKLSSPFWLPVWFFAIGITTGAVLLRTELSLGGNDLGWVDAFFTATSAMCVTGLAVVDTGSHFTRAGQSVILGLIQVGGFGYMVHTSLTMYLFGRHVPLADRIAVSQSLLHDPAFNLGRFVLRVLLGTLAVEAVGAVALYALDPVGFSPYSAIFHSVSAFCNAGFSLFGDSLTAWQTDWAVCSVFMVLITLGGLGFFVLGDVASVLRSRAGRLAARCADWRCFGSRGRRCKTSEMSPRRLRWHSLVVLRTSLFLTLAGMVLFFLAEWTGGEHSPEVSQTLLTALFNSVTCRTAGFNTVEISHLTNLSLVFMLMLMFIGGSPGSCAGGIKTTTARTLFAFCVAQVRGRSQVRLGRFAISPDSVRKAMTLTMFALLLVGLAVVLLNVTEGGDVPHYEARGHFLESVFETVSAFGTVGLSTGMTTRLSPQGKLVVMLLMFVGRLGPIWLLSALQSWQRDVRYRLPEEDLPLG